MSSESSNKIRTAAQNQLTEALTMLFDSGEDSDLTVQCGNRVWKLHRVILRAGSEYFKTACQRDKFKEGSTGTIELKDDDPPMAGLLLRYFYAHDYHVDDNGKAPLIVHVRMYAIADKYGVPLLKDLARERFTTSLHDIQSKGTSSDLLDIPTFITALDLIYTSTLPSDRGLRDAIIPTMLQFKTFLRASDQFMGLVTTGLGDGDFTVDVIDAWAKLGRVASCSWRCGKCKIVGSGPLVCCGTCKSYALSVSYSH